MRNIATVVGTALLAACGESARIIEGGFAEGELPQGLYVAIAPADTAIAVQDGRFRVEAAGAGPVVLRIGAPEEEDLGVVAVDGLGDGAHLRLERIRLPEGNDYAMPSAVRIAGGDAVSVNGIRFADADRLPERMEGEARVLAADEEAGLLLLRLRDPQLPDMPTLLLPATLVFSADGEPMERDRLDRDDVLRVVGPVRNGYLMARELRLLDPDASPPAAGEPGGSGEGDPGMEGAEAARVPPAVRPDRPFTPEASTPRKDRRKERKENGKGKRKENGKGNGRGNQRRRGAGRRRVSPRAPGGGHA